MAIKICCGVFIALCFSALITSSCNAPTLQSEDYIKHLENSKNGFVVTNQVGEYVFKAQLAPPEYIVLKETASDCCDSMYINRIKELQDAVYIILKFYMTDEARAAKGGDLFAQQQLSATSMLQYFGQEAAKDIKLCCNDKKVSPASYLFENNYELAPYNTIVLGFITDLKLNDMDVLQLQFNDRYHNTGMMNFSFERSNLKRLPHLSHQ